MPAPSIHRSATKELRILVDEAEDRGYREGLARGIELAVGFLAGQGEQGAATKLRAAKLVADASEPVASNND